MGFKEKFPLVLQGTAPGRSQESVGGAEGLWVGSQETLGFSWPGNNQTAQLLGAEQGTPNPVLPRACPSPIPGCLEPGDGQELRALSGTEGLSFQG